MNEKEKQDAKFVLLWIIFMTIIGLLIFIPSSYLRSKLTKKHLYTVGVLRFPVSIGKFYGWKYEFYYENEEYSGTIGSNSTKNYYSGKKYIVMFETDNPTNNEILEDYIINDSLPIGDTLNRKEFNLP